MQYTAYFFHMLEHKPKSFPCIQSTRICCPAEADPCELRSVPTQIPYGMRMQFERRACRATGMLCSPRYLPPIHACLPGGKQPRDSLSEHAWWYTKVTQSHSRLLASGDKPCLLLEGTLGILSWGKPEGTLQNTALIYPKFCMGRWKVFVSPSVGSRLSRSNLWSIATPVHSTAYHVKHFITTCFSGNTAGCLKF